MNYPTPPAIVYQATDSGDADVAFGFSEPETSPGFAQFEEDHLGVVRDDAINLLKGDDDHAPSMDYGQACVSPVLPILDEDEDLDDDNFDDDGNFIGIDDDDDLDGDVGTDGDDDDGNFIGIDDDDDLDGDVGTDGDDNDWDDDEDDLDDDEDTSCGSLDDDGDFED